MPKIWIISITLSYFILRGVTLGVNRYPSRPTDLGIVLFVLGNVLLAVLMYFVGDKWFIENNIDKKTSKQINLILIVIGLIVSGLQILTING
ncbi:MAG: hypothetical protein M3Q44_02395 [bacterium]|nr:hypothetical protein [bacterium]